MVSAELASR